MRTRYKGIKKELWFSYCSQHREYHHDCRLCNIGSWQNAILYKIDTLFYISLPCLWRWAANKNKMKI